MKNKSGKSKAIFSGALATVILSSPTVAFASDSWSDIDSAAKTASVADTLGAATAAASSATETTTTSTTTTTTTTEKTVLNADTPQKASGHRPKVALALGGGGMRGAAHVGVLKVLQESGIPIDYIAGTSMGAIVGGLYSAG
ncbi:MAG TPA: patatin-like phospholipase family protein, partial [Chroococcales cyanobacterium]